MPTEENHMTVFQFQKLAVYIFHFHKLANFFEMKILLWSVFAHLCADIAFGGETCVNFVESEETGCKYEKSLVLVSSPDGERVDGNNCNSHYEKAVWQQTPKIYFPDAKNEKTYTLVNIDPDPPGYQKGQYYLHWLVSNIKGEDFAKGDFSAANQLTGYRGPNPPSGSGVHRYIFLAFEEKQQNGKLENPEGRSKFEFESWLRRQENLCGPVAGIQFRTQF